MPTLQLGSRHVGGKSLALGLHAGEGEGHVPALARMPRRTVRARRSKTGCFTTEEAEYNEGTLRSMRSRQSSGHDLLRVSTAVVPAVRSQSALPRLCDLCVFYDEIRVSLLL